MGGIIIFDEESKKILNILIEEDGWRRRCWVGLRVLSVRVCGVFDFFVRGSAREIDENNKEAAEEEIREETEREAQEKRKYSGASRVSFLRGRLSGNTPR